ncbi:MAG: hypothetical protein IJ600_00145 [Lachnospiraceae bacterium]|nr:hypothetical protein [Lachnospiraceae bacterium]
MMRTITAYDICHIGEKLYCVCNEFNALVRYDCLKRKNEFVGRIPDEQLYAKSLFSKIIHYDDKMVFIPLFAQKIWIYDYINNEWQGIEIENPDCGDKFMQAVVCGNVVYILPYKYNKMLKLNLSNYELEYVEIDEPKCELEKKIYFRSDIVIKNNRIYAAYGSGDYVFEFDLVSEKCNWVRIGTGCSGYSGIAWDGRRFWLASRTEEKPIKVYSWDNTIYNEIEVEDYGNEFVRGIFYDDGHVFLRKNTRTIEIDINSLEVSSEDKEAYFFLKKDDIYSALTYNGKYVYYDDRKKEIDLKVSDEDVKVFFKNYVIKDDKNYFTEKGIVQENSLINLEAFLIGI